jgi:hypothetical protein
MDYLLRLPPLRDIDFDTPAARFGALLGWVWGDDLPDAEEDLLSRLVKPSPGEDYATTDFPKHGGRIIGAVLMGYWGYYLTQATRDPEIREGNVPLDSEIWSDYLEWQDSHSPEGVS